VPASDEPHERSHVDEQRANPDGFRKTLIRKRQHPVVPQRLSIPSVRPGWVGVTLLVHRETEPTCDAVRLDARDSTCVSLADLAEGTQAAAGLSSSACSTASRSPA
jgi:hypothetical protein